MKERIMVPLDGSKVGEAALPFVGELLSKFAPGVEKEIILLQVLSPIEISTLVGEEYPDIRITEKSRKDQIAKATEYLEKVGKALGINGATITPKIVFGNAAEEIVKVADEMQANLIAMSTHGRSGIGRWAFGSITDKVLRYEESVPIFLVRAPKGK